MPVIRLSTALTLLALAASMATAQGRAPAGKYCGELLSAGVMSAVETSFQSNAGSRTINGSYVFAEQGQPVEGLLTEAGDDGDGNDLTRTFIWRDKYGYGKLILTFTPGFFEFTGEWRGSGPNAFPWHGKRCNLVTS